VNETTLSAWESFYIIVGSSAGALTGLQFVVITLIAGSRRTRTKTEIDTFGTPTVVHFCLVLLLSAFLSAPWEGFAGVGLALAATGAGGLGYCGVVVRRARQPLAYRPVFEDWLWHTILPVLAYTILLLAGLGLMTRPSPLCFFAIATTSLLLLFAGIHNAWDTVTFIAVDPDQGATP
jgi:hypothetical protein